MLLKEKLLRNTLQDLLLINTSCFEMHVFDNKIESISQASQIVLIISNYQTPQPMLLHQIIPWWYMVKNKGPAVNSFIIICYNWQIFKSLH